MCNSLDEDMQFAKDLGVVPAADLVVEGSNDASTSKLGGIDKSSPSVDEQHPNTECLNTGRLGRAFNVLDNHDVDKVGIEHLFCVIKPTRGVVSDNVQFCSSLDEVKDAFEKVQGTSVFGSIMGEKHDFVVSLFLIASKNPYLSMQNHEGGNNKSITRALILQHLPLQTPNIAFAVGTRICFWDGICH